MSTLAPPLPTQPATAVSSSTKYVVLIGALIIQLILGTVYGYSIFWEPLDRAVWPPVMSQAKAAELTAAGTPPAAGAMILADDAAVAKERRERQMYVTFCLAICLLSFSATMIFAGRLQDRIGPTKTALVGGVLMGIGFLVASRLDALATAPQGRLATLWLTIGMLAGVGIGFAYVCPIAALVKWFPHRKGLMSGIAVAGFGLGAFIFSNKQWFGASYYLQRHDILSLFQLHGVICLVAIVLGALALRNPPAGYGVAAKKAAGSGVDLTWNQTIRTGRFYLIWLMFFSGSMAGLTVIGIIKTFAGQQLVDAAQATGTALTTAGRDSLLLEGAAAVGMLSIFNAAGRVFWGLVSDRIGRTASLMLMYSLQGVTMLSLTRLDTTGQLAVGAASVGFNYGGCFALFPSLTADLFGSKNLGANYAWVFTSYGVAGVLGTLVAGTANVWTGSYSAAFSLAAGLCFLTAILALVLRRVTARTIAA